MRYIYKLIISLLLLVFSISLANQEAGLPFIKNFSPREYDGHTQNWAIAQDQRGVMYFGNGKGVLEYDGTSWRLLQLPNKSAVRSLAVSTNGRIYVGAKNEFGYLAPDSVGFLEFKSLTPLLSSEYLDFNDVWETSVTGSFAYFRTSKAIFRYNQDSNSIHIWETKTRFHMSGVVNGEFYVRHDGIGLQKEYNDSLILVPGGDVLKDISIYSLLRLENNEIFIGSSTKGLFIYDGQHVRKFETEIESQISESWFSHAAQLTDGTLALTTRYGGLFVVDKAGALVRHIGESAGLRDNAIWFSYVDQQGGLWVALNDGLSRIEIPSSLTYFDDKTGLDGKVQDIKRFNGTLYFATSPSGVYCLQNERSVMNGVDSQKPLAKIKGIETQCWSLLPYKNRLLVAANSGLYEIGGEDSKQVLEAERGIFEPSVLKQFNQNDNYVLAGLYDGFAVLTQQAGQWSVLGRIKGINGEVRTIVELENGEIWLGTRSGYVYRIFLNESNFKNLADSKFEIFDESNGLPPGQIQVFSFNNRVAFTTESQGLYFFQENSGMFKPDTTLGSQFTNGHIDVELLAQDSNGNVWLGSEEAGRVDFVKKIDEKKFVAVPTECERIPTSSVFSILTEKNGIVWFSTNDGLVRFDPTVKRQNAGNFKTFVRKVSTLNDSVLFSNKQNALSNRLPYHLNSIRIDFSAASFIASESNQFQTKLEGFEKSWSSWSNLFFREFTNLSPGKYSFQVVAKNVYGELGQPSQIEFIIDPPLYRTWFAYAIYVLVVMGMLYSIRRYELKRHKIKMDNDRREREIEEARQLQLSLLPKELPQRQDMDIAVYMKTASEVGGDYYDFYEDNGALSVIVGDATGHGLRAGTLVTATKSVLATTLKHSNVKKVFCEANNALKSLQLGNFFMALAAMKIENYRADICSAGMPPILIHRAKSNCVEEIEIKAMPLGGFRNFPYNVEQIELNAGDTIILMSDGFPERFNEEDEILGYDKAEIVLQKNAQKSASEIIEQLVKESDTWANNRQLNDDMTFVAIKMK